LLAGRPCASRNLLCRGVPRRYNGQSPFPLPPLRCGERDGALFMRALAPDLQKGHAGAFNNACMAFSLPKNGRNGFAKILVLNGR